MKILLTRDLQDVSIEKLKKRHEVEIHRGKIPMPKKKLMDRIRDKEGLICYPYDSIDSQVINAGINLKAISTFSVGYDHIDFKASSKKGIVVSYTPDVLTNTTADLTMGLILSLLRKVVEGDSIIRKNKWKSIFGPQEFLGIDLHKKCIGIFGMGRIGSAVATRAKGFGMHVLYHNRKRLTKEKEKKLGAEYVSFDKLFTKSDVISVHVPYTSETHGIIDLDVIKKMKRTAFLVNTARGKIINEADLISALKKKLIKGAALDVFQNEPIGSSHPLTKFSNVVLTPHSGSSTVETRKKMAEITVKNLMLSLIGKDPIYQVKVR